MVKIRTKNQLYLSYSKHYCHHQSALMAIYWWKIKQNHKTNKILHSIISFISLISTDRWQWWWALVVYMYVIISTINEWKKPKVKQSVMQSEINRSSSRPQATLNAWVQRDHLPSWINLWLIPVEKHNRLECVDGMSHLTWLIRLMNQVISLTWAA